MTPSDAAPSIVAGALAAQGFIADDGSELARAARSVWEQWWATAKMPDLATSRDRIRAVLSAARPHVKHFANRRADHIDPAVTAWVRTDCLVVASDGQPFPYHHSADEVAEYLTNWTRDAAEREMEGAYWDLLARPGGWAARVTTNGHHRSLLAMAAGVPVVKVKVTAVRRWDGEQTIYHPYDTVRVRLVRDTRTNGVRLKVPRRVPPVKRVERYDRAGLCTFTRSRISESGTCELFLEDVDPLLPWIAADTDKEVRERHRQFCSRFGFDPHGDWRLGSAALRPATPSSGAATSPVRGPRRR